MQHNKIIVFIILFVNYSLSSQNNINFTNQLPEFQRIVTDISKGKSKKNIEIDGNKYFFKKNSEAKIFLRGDNKSITAPVNYNYVDQVFEMVNRDMILELDPSKISGVEFENDFFTVYKGTFYKLITENDNFSVLKFISVVLVKPDYVPGIEDKPNLRYRRDDQMFILKDDKLRKFKLNKKVVISLFKNNDGEIKKFIKNNKISLRDDAELKKLFDTFKNNLNR
tara:strand:+ start:732 stop:1403 length:672 start_codon:yes stop_codon:yes gene_type:complete